MRSSGLAIAVICLVGLAGCGRGSHLTHAELLSIHDDTLTDLAKQEKIAKLHISAGLVPGKNDARKTKMFLTPYPDGLIFLVDDVAEKNDKSMVVSLRYSKENSSPADAIAKEMVSATGIGSGWIPERLQEPANSKWARKLKKGDSIQSLGWVRQIEIYNIGNKFMCDAGSIYRSKNDLLQHLQHD